MVFDVLTVSGCSLKGAFRSSFWRARKVLNEHSEWRCPMKMCAGTAQSPRLSLWQERRKCCFNRFILMFISSMFISSMFILTCSSDAAWRVSIRERFGGDLNWWPNTFGDLDSKVYDLLRQLDSNASILNPLTSRTLKFRCRLQIAIFYAYLL